MTCPNCGASVTEGRRFCGKCGVALSEPPAPADVSAAPPPPGPAPASGQSASGPSTPWGPPVAPAPQWGPPPSPAPSTATPTGPQDPFAPPELTPPPGPNPWAAYDATTGQYPPPGYAGAPPQYPPGQYPPGQYPPGYPGQPGYGYGYGYGPPHTNGLAITSFVLGLAPYHGRVPVGG